MIDVMLYTFIEAHREEILVQARARVALRSTPGVTEIELTEGLPMFLDQLGSILRREDNHEISDHTDIENTAGLHGNSLFRRGLSVAQVVHDYGDLCQIITKLVIEEDASVSTTEFQTLNLCLDEAIASAVTAFGLQKELALSNAATEKLGILAHEMRNVLNGAILSFACIKKGVVALGGATSAMLDRSHMRLNTLIDRSLVDVRLEAGMKNMEHISVCDILEEVEIGASMVALSAGLRLVVAPIDSSVIVEADRQILAAAVANLVQNALKFTHKGSTVRLRAMTTETRVLIEVEDECGGLPIEKHAKLLQPFSQDSENRTGLGLGLFICVKAMKTMSGELTIRDLPGKGCVFAISLPKQPPPPISLVGRKPPIVGVKGGPISMAG